VRRFAGTVPSKEYWDASLKALARAKLVHGDLQGQREFELLGDDDAVFGVNGAPARKYVKIVSITASPRPTDAVEFAVPSEWYSGHVPFEPHRRRQSAEEADGIRGYARGFWRRLWIVPILFLFPGGALRDFLYGSLKLPLSICPGMSAAGAALLSGLVLFRPWREARMLKADAEFGWAIIVPPHTYTDKRGVQRTQQETVEILPISEALWTIEGNPAGWRHRR
jgi:hypothetical protein